MGEYFRGWKRKFGVVTLLMALALMAGWVRSSAYINVIRCPSGTNTSVAVSSGGGLLAWERDYEEKPANIPKSIEFYNDIYRVGNNCFTAKILKWKWRFFGFGVAEIPLKGTRIEIVFWPYWSITIPLTLLSAFLLFSKPRKSTPIKVVEPIPAEGT